jgi:hypothetical protein
LQARAAWADTKGKLLNATLRIVLPAFSEIIGQSVNAQLPFSPTMPSFNLFEVFLKRK